MSVLKGLFGSKKFITGISGVVAVLAAVLFKLDISEELLMSVLGVIATIVLGFAAQDHGKEATKIAAGTSGANVPRVDPK